MKVLVTNDDGILAPGLIALTDILRGRFDIFVVAPASAESASAHSITLYNPLVCHNMKLPNGIEGVSVEGRPADCVKLALVELFPEKFKGAEPDLVVSGINAGANVGINVLYSGTVASAIESAFFNIPAIAISLAVRDKLDFDYAAREAKKVIDFILDRGILESGIVLNVNIPPVEFGGPVGIKFVRQSTRVSPDRFEKRKDPRGRTYYWLTGNGNIHMEDSDETDITAILRNYITITPLMYDLTDYKALAKLFEVKL